jgi:formamidopyrimidine-DNA glycosylase
VPELPEVETIRRQLAPLVEGRRLERIEVLDWRWSRPLSPGEMGDALTGRRIERLGRRGKYLLWELEDDMYLAQHLRMTGSVLAAPDPEPSHTRVRMQLGPRSRSKKTLEGRDQATMGPPGKLRLALVDPRRFGTGELLIGRLAVEGFFDARLGLEPLDEAFTAEHLHSVMKGRRMPIKALLLDQRRVAGIGNIYADEALFRAGIHPLRPAGQLTLAQAARLRETSIESLLAGIDAKGASIDDFRHVDGVRGSFQDRFLVHLREGEPCVNCATTIVKMVAAGRGTYVCETCQPRPRLRRRGAAPASRSRRPPAAR